MRRISCPQRANALQTARQVGLHARLFLLALLLCLTTLPAAAADIRLGDKIVPVFQAITLELDAGQTHYRGSVRVDLEVKQPTRTILLHAEGHEIERMALESAEGLEIPLHHEMADAQTLALTTETDLVQGSYTLDIDFTSPFGTRAVGLYRMEQDGLPYAFSQFEADDAREAFPCWDEPSFKIPFQITLKVPEEHVAVSNTPVVEETTNAGWRTVSFKKTKPLPTYLLAIATGPLESVPLPGLGVPGRIYTVRGQSHLTNLAIQTTPPLLRALEDYFGTPYPYEKLDFIAIPEYWPGAMENAGAITYADDILLLEPAAASVRQRRRLAGVIAHELAHQWFGDLVTMKWWDDLWLNESFANWMGEKITNQVFPELGGDLAQAQRAQQILGVDARTTTEPIRRPVDTAKNLLEGLGVTYQKGTAVLNMFERWLGPEPFRQGIRDYLTAHAWGNAEAADLWKALDASSGKKLSVALATFIEQAGHPLISVTAGDPGQIILSQQRFRNHGADSPNQLWDVPIRLKYPVGDQVVTQDVFLKGESTTVHLELPEGASTPQWIFPHAGSVGFYRWLVEPKIIRKMATHASELLSPRERIGLLGNVSALLDAGLLSGGDYLAILGTLANDPEALVVNAAVGELGQVQMAFVPAELEEPFNAWVRRTLGPALDRFGIEKKPGESEVVDLVRPRLISWLGRAGREDVLQASRKMAEAYMNDTTAVDPSLVGPALRLAAQQGDQKLFDAYKKHFEAARSPVDREQFLVALGAFQRPELRQAALAYAKEGPVRPNEVFSIGQAMSSDIAGRDLIFSWFTENYDFIMARIPPMFASFAPSIANGCSQERLKTATEFFSQPSRHTPGVAKTLSQVSEQVNQCVTLRAREGKAVAQFLTTDAP